MTAARALKRFAFALAALTAGAFAGPAVAEEPPLRVFAAASLADALDEILAAYEAETGRAAIGVYAASGALARQIDAGAPADLYISAHPEWPNWLAARDALRGDAERLAGNVLVIVARTPPAGAPGPEILLTADRIAVADLAAAPAGRYAAEALRGLDLWDALADRLVEAADARAVAAWVARGEAPFGIMYATDAAIAELSIVTAFPPDAHEPIVYVIATPREAHPDADALKRRLLGPAAQRVLRDRGFMTFR